MQENEMTTVRLFDADSHCRDFQATVLRCIPDGADGCYAVLDRTAFFPEGGGQSGDRGFLDEVPVTDTIEKDGIIYHHVVAPLTVGSCVSGQLDFAERFDKMQQHTGEHMICGIVHRMYGYNNVGFHLSNDVTTFDFDGELSWEQAQEVETLANEAVFANHPVKIYYPDRASLADFDYRSKNEIEGQVRLVEITDVDLCACCAPHVNGTAEVGLIKILSCERHRGGCRMTIVCGMRALKDYRQKQCIIGKASAALSAKQETIPETISHFQGQQQKLREQLNRVQSLYLEEKLKAISKEDECVCIFEEGLDPIAVRNFVNAAMERCDGVCGAFVGNECEGYHYILGSRTKNVRETANELNRRFHGKGGGKPQMVQGSLTGREIDIRKVLGGQ